MRTLALYAWLVMFSPIDANALTIPLVPKPNGAATPPKSPVLEQCDEWAVIVRDIAAAREGGQPMSSYIASLRKAGGDPGFKDIQLIQRIYSTNLHPDDVAALWRKECYAAMQ